MPLPLRPYHLRASIPEELRAWLEAEAERRQVSLSTLVWRLLEERREQKPQETAP